MVVSKEYVSSHFEDRVIPVEFVVLHYTAQSLKESLRILTSGPCPVSRQLKTFIPPASFVLSSGSHPVSCHLLIDEEGKLYELVECWEGVCKKAFHAGKSRFVDSQGKKWERFNDFSIGIELVNWNGNVFPFTDYQYRSLQELLHQLKNVYPALRNPERIVGHEHIAGFRGKKDPGGLFDWTRFFKSVYPEQAMPARKPVWTKKQCRSLARLQGFPSWNDKKARQVSLIMENSWLPFWLKTLLFRLVFLTLK